MVKVLFVCLGNICRSPSAEGIFDEIVEEAGLSDKILIDSAGTSAYHVGEKADSRMRKCASRRGYTLTSRSRKIELSDLEEFDYIIAMDNSNYRDILSLNRSPSLKDKVKLITDFSVNYVYQDVPDPYYGGPEGFDNVIDILEESCQGLLNFIKENERL